MLAFEVGDLNVWVEDLPDGVQHVYGEDGHGGRALVISPKVSAEIAIGLVKRYAGQPGVADLATVRLLKTA